MTQRGRLSWKGLLVLAIGVLALWGLAGTTAEGAVTSTAFQMIRTAGLPGNCVPSARADVRIVSNGRPRP